MTTTTRKQRAKSPASKKPAVTKKVAPVAKKPKAAVPTKLKAPKPAASAMIKEKEITKKEKMVRDSFNMPASDYALIAELKKRALTSAKAVKKSELLRAGLRLLAKMDSKELIETLAAVPPLKAGRPKK